MTGNTREEQVGVAAEDLKFAQLAIRVHCPISWPEGTRCLNCRAEYPCSIRRWAAAALFAAGWSATQIEALDLRTGAWS